VAETLDRFRATLRFLKDISNGRFPIAVDQGDRRATTLASRIMTVDSSYGIATHSCANASDTHSPSPPT